MDILLVGLNHRTAPIEMRERLAFSDEEIRATLPELCRQVKADEAWILSTCNRTEILMVSRASDCILGDAVLVALCALCKREFIAVESAVYELHGTEAVRHVLQVTAGLDSMVLGEPQILAQARQAYALATEAGTNRLYVNKILHLAFRAGKRVRTETEVGYGAVSVAFVAVTLAKKVFAKLESHTALVVGAGDMAEAAAAHLKEQPVGRLLFANRTLEKAVQLASRFDGEAMSLENLSRGLERADIVICSTGAPDFIVTRDPFRHAMEKRHNRPMLLIDMAVPRDIDPAINKESNTFVYDMDDLKQVTDLNLARRSAAIPAAEAIIDEEMASFDRWRENLKVEPVIKLLHDRFDQVRKRETGKNLKRFCAKEEDDLDKLTLGIQKKLLHRPTEFLRQCDPETDEGQRTMEIIRNLFDLK